MVNTPNPLWERIERFQTDEPGHQLPFSLKLAQEHGWSAHFAQRAIFEYKRFVYLCCVLPCGASPPPVVDAVWHLHLTYTRSYWLDFCPNCLGQDLHHTPSAGGLAEGQRHRDWYSETLAAYEQVFDQPPPPDIWPSPKAATAPISPDRMPGPRISILLVLSGGLAMLPVYFLPGPAFLCCFGLFLIWCGIVRGIHYRKCSSILAGELFQNGSLLLPELAFISGNKQRIRQLVIADGISKNIFRQQLLGWEIDQTLLQRERPFYADWFAGIDKINEADLLKRIDLEAEKYAAPLRPLESWLKRNGFPWSVVIVPALLGAARIFQGLANQRPVGLLVMELIIFALIMGAMPVEPRFHSRMAKAMKSETVLAGELIGAGVAGSVVLDGMRALAARPEFQTLSPTLLADWAEPRFPTHAGGAGSSCGSSCSSSSCGSSCGGGCGGCGGGD
jgi:hypothetical protein